MHEPCDDLLRNILQNVRVCAPEQWQQDRTTAHTKHEDLDQSVKARSQQITNLHALMHARLLLSRLTVPLVPGGPMLTGDGNPDLAARYWVLAQASMCIASFAFSHLEVARWLVR